MKIRQFEHMVDVYGASHDRWPEDLREEALALLNGDPVAGGYLAKAQKIDHVLDLLPVPVPASTALTASIMNIPGRYPQTQTAAPTTATTEWGGWFSWWPFGNVFGGPVPQLGGLMLACALGIMLGSSDLGVNPWGGSDLTTLAMGLDTPAAIASFEGLNQ